MAQRRGWGSSAPLCYLKWKGSASLTIESTPHWCRNSNRKSHHKLEDLETKYLVANGSLPPGGHRRHMRHYSLCSARKISSHEVFLLHCLFSAASSMMGPYEIARRILSRIPCRACRTRLTWL